MKRVFSSHDRLAVHHARNLLEAHGVHAVVKNDVLASAMGELPPAECQAELWVHADSAERAKAILAPKQHSGPAWRCATCAETCEAQFTQCWRCGAYRAA